MVWGRRCNGTGGTVGSFIRLVMKFPINHEGDEDGDSWEDRLMEALSYAARALEGGRSNLNCRWLGQ